MGDSGGLQRMHQLSKDIANASPGAHRAAAHSTHNSQHHLYHISWRGIPARPEQYELSSVLDINICTAPSLRPLIADWHCWWAGLPDTSIKTHLNKAENATVGTGGRAVLMCRVPLPCSSIDAADFALLAAPSLLPLDAALPTALATATG